jgi:hypothetical protein
MFEAFILVCAMNIKDECMELQDTRGPYETRQLCKTRVDEMFTSMLPIIPPNSDMKWKCVQTTGVNT